MDICISEVDCMSCNHFECTSNWDDCEEGKCHFIESELGKSVQKLLDSFPNSFINYNKEFIANLKSNQYIILHNCETVLDIKCKVIEWFSRPAHKTSPYNQEWRNKKFHEFMLNGLNKFLDTDFNYDDMDLIYT